MWVAREAKHDYAEKVWSKGGHSKRIPRITRGLSATMFKQMYSKGVYQGGLFRLHAGLSQSPTIARGIAVS